MIMLFEYLHLIKASLFLAQVYQRSRPKADSLSLMKDQGSSENSEVWKNIYVEIKSFKL